MFNNAFNILEKAESEILYFPSEPILTGWWGIKLNKFIRTFSRSLSYIKFGVKLLFKPFFTWLCLALCLSALLAIFGLLASEGAVILEPIVMLSVLFSLPLILFSVPSTYVCSGIDKSVISELTDYILELEINNRDLVECTEQSCEILKKSCKSRISAYRWFLASMWAVAILWINFEIKLVPLFFEQNMQEALELMKEHLIALCLLIGFMVIPFTLIASYNKASDVLFSTIEFSLIETKGALFR